MKSSAILTMAAELVDSKIIGLLTLAVHHASAGNMDGRTRAMAFVHRHFGPDIGRAGGFDDNQHRVLALLLCAAIAESEGD